MKKIPLALLTVSLLLGALGTQAADIDGSKDYTLLKRFDGSEIIGYKTYPFDEYMLLMEAGLGGEFSGNLNYKLSKPVGGAITRIIYHVPTGHSTFEVYSSFKQVLAEAKFNTLIELTPSDLDRSFPGIFYGRATMEDSGSPNPFWDNKDPYYLAAELLNSGGKDIYVALLVSLRDRDNIWCDPQNRYALDDKYQCRIQVHHNEIIVGLDVIEAKVTQNKVVFVKAPEMADTINKTGKIDVYGIAFDTDKTDIRPESMPTLVEVGKLLRDNPSWKLEVSDHTDNTGNSQHSQTLSEGRAGSVVSALVNKYHVDDSRLVSKGYGDTKPVADNATEDGRAKNRRIELSKIQ